MASIQTSRSTPADCHSDCGESCGELGLARRPQPVLRIGSRRRARDGSRDRRPTGDERDRGPGRQRSRQAGGRLQPGAETVGQRRHCAGPDGPGRPAGDGACRTRGRRCPAHGALLMARWLAELKRPYPFPPLAPAESAFVGVTSSRPDCTIVALACQIISADRQAPPVTRPFPGRRHPDAARSGKTRPDPGSARTASAGQPPARRALVGCPVTADLAPARLTAPG